jgi:hypothetical protein
MLRRVVDSLVASADERPSYLSFARELARTLRRPPVPDFSLATRRVVMKWFRRGLSGGALWRIGAALIGRMFGPVR